MSETNQLSSSIDQIVINRHIVEIEAELENLKNDILPRVQKSIQIIETYLASMKKEQSNEERS